MRSFGVNNTGRSNLKLLLLPVVWLLLSLFSAVAYGQGEAKVSARIDATQIMVGDQARLFIEAQHDPTTGRLLWAPIPDTFNNLEVVERGKIDTVKQGNINIYRQRLMITGFDSGSFMIPSFVFAVIPAHDTPYTIQTDSMSLLVQTVPVDTTKAFKPIKGIIFVKSNWRDYIGYIAGSILFIALVVFVVIYFMKNKKVPIPKPQGPAESLTDKTLRLLSELDAKQLWQKQKVKEYYIELTDIVRTYIERRFHTPALELTTDELLYKAQLHKELQSYHSLLSFILHTADMAKFAKAEPLPQEHTDAMEKAIQFVKTSRPVIITQNPTE